MTDCSICLDPTDKKKKACACASCGIVYCLPCVESHLLASDTNDPVCPDPACRAAWTPTFLYGILRREFRTGPYQKVREKILFDREKARLPATQEDAKRCREATLQLPILKESISAVQARIKSLPEVLAFRKADAAFKRSAVYRHAYEDRSRKWKQLMGPDVEVVAPAGNLTAAFQAADRALDDLYDAWRAGAEAPHLAATAVIVDTELVPLTRKSMAARESIATWGAPLATSKKVVEEKKTFLMKCVKATCEGFLSEEYTCGLCDLQVCSECHVAKGPDHACDPATVATIRQIRKEAHPCPVCAALISKIDGCDQMWCTQCNTAFSWTTGRVETGVVHNPHYFQYMREMGRAVPRRHNPGFGCDAVHDIERTLFHLCAQEGAPVGLLTEILETYRNVLHVREVDLIEYRRGQVRYLEHEWRRVLRVKRLLHEIDDSEWKTALQREEKSYYKITAWVHLLEMYTTVSIEAFARITDAKSAISSFSEYEKIRIYAAQEAKVISRFYGCVLPKCFQTPKAAEGE